MGDGDDVYVLVGWLVREGRTSVYKHETRAECIRGSLAGFEIVCGLPPTLEAYAQCLAGRRRREMEMVGEGADAEVYWEHRCATAQVEHVYECLKVVYGAPVLSSLAVMQVAEYAARVRAYERLAHGSGGHGAAGGVLGCSS